MAKVDTSKLQREVLRLEQLETARNRQIARFWGFLSALRDRLDETDPEAASMVRKFIVEDNLFTEQRSDAADSKAA